MESSRHIGNQDKSERSQDLDGLFIAANDEDIPDHKTDYRKKVQPGQICNKSKGVTDGNNVPNNHGQVNGNNQERDADGYPPAVVKAHQFNEPLACLNSNP